jgi:hypothetical protein
MNIVRPFGIRNPHPFTVTGDLPKLLAVTLIYDSTTPALRATIA